MTAFSEFLKSSIICVAIVLCHASSFSQTDTSLYVTYGGIYEDEITRVIYDSDSNLVYCGSSSSFNNYGRSGFMMKTDTLLNEIWTVTYQNDGYSEFRDMVVLDDNFFLTGRVLNGSSGYDVLVAAFNADGELLWDRNLGSDEWDEANSISAVSEGFLITGSSYGNSPNSKDGVVYKLDLNGELLWTKYFDQGFHESLNDGKESLEGNYIFGGSIEVSDEQSNMWFLVTNSDGDVLIENTWEEEGVNYITSILADDQTENYFLCGQIYNSLNESLDGYTSRLDELGGVIWADTIEWSGTQRWNSIEFGNTNELVLCGSTENGPAGNEGTDFLVKRLISNGVFLDQRTHGTSDDEVALNGIRIDNGYVFVGTTDGLGKGQNDGLIVRTRNSGSDENYLAQEVSADVDFTYTSLEEKESKSKSIYFNSGFLYSSEEITSAEIYSGEGKLIKDLRPFQNSVDLKLESGVYILVVNKTEIIRIAY